MNDLSTQPLQTLIESSNEWSFPIDTCDMHTVTNFESIDVPPSMARCIVRTDTNQVLGVHGSKYKAVKHDDVVNSVFDAVDAAGISNDYNHMIKTYDNGAKLKGVISRRTATRLFEWHGEPACSRKDMAKTYSQHRCQSQCIQTASCT